MTAIAGAVFGGGGLFAAAGTLLKVRHDNRKSSADAAGVLAGASAAFAAEVRADAAVARADAAAAREDAARSHDRTTHLRAMVETLHARVLAIDSCVGGIPCPLRPAPRFLMPGDGT